MPASVFPVFCDKDQQGQKSMYYSTAIDKEKRHEIQGHREIDCISIPKGEFLAISHQGNAKECIKFSIYLFNEVLPKLRDEFGGGIEMEVMRSIVATPNLNYVILRCLHLPYVRE
ncbi:AraC family transcriptional regulator [Yersinia enterocolitica]|nr:AraC family transcriptional regulator [Yersinia enterocolitica]